VGTCSGQEGRLGYVLTLGRRSPTVRGSFEPSAHARYTVARESTAMLTRQALEQRTRPISAPRVRYSALTPSVRRSSRLVFVRLTLAVARRAK